MRRRIVGLVLVAVVVVAGAIVLWPDAGRPRAAGSGDGPAKSTATVERRTLRESEIVSGTFGYETAVALVHRVDPGSGGSGGGSGTGSGSGSSGAGSGSGSGAGDQGGTGGGGRNGPGAGGGGGGTGTGGGARTGSGASGGAGSGSGSGNAGGGAGSGDGGSGSGNGSAGRGAGSGDGGSGSGSDEASGDGGASSGGGTSDGSGGGTLTAIAPVGRIVRRGETLYRVDQRPVLLLYGHVPVWRTMHAGLRGSDVRQLQLNLAALGFGPITVDGVFRQGTADVVRRWQRSVGLPRTGRVTLGQIAFADGPRRISTHEAAIGTPVGDGTTVLKTTSTVRRVQIPLDVAKQQLARLGARVTVTLPDQRTVGGRIVKIGAVTAGDSGGGDGGAGAGGGSPKAKLDVLVRLNSERGTGRLDAAPVSVALTREIRRRVLSVPVTALIARRGGGYAVRVVRGTGTIPVPVTVGMFSDGLAEVSGGGVREGDEVAVPDAE